MRSHTNPVAVATSATPEQGGAPGVALQLELHVDQLVPAAIQLGHQGAEILAQGRDVALELTRGFSRRGVRRLVAPVRGRRLRLG